MNLRHFGPVSFLALLAGCLIAVAAAGSAQSQIHFPWQAHFATIPATDASGHGMTPLAAAAHSALQTFSYTVTSSRDGNAYSGEMVGQSPFINPKNLDVTTVETPIIPVIVTTHSFANSSLTARSPGTTVFDPTAAQQSCLSAPHNNPLTLLHQSPIFHPVNFSFGGTDVGTTQYVDAFQRANFWSDVAGTNYHTILSPEILPPIHLNVPGDQGFTIATGTFGNCGPLAVVNIYYLLQQLAFPLRNINSSNLPIFFFYNTVLSIGSKLNSPCCVLGFHAAGQVAPGGPIQTYAFISFETTLFPSTIFDSAVAAHEIGEWMDDPFGNNRTPRWGHIGQVPGCQGNLEVGDPLTATALPTVVVGANGFPYHLQELAFFSWFYGAPSIASNGWFSDNDTFKSDAGPVCTSP